jgi:RimJ/RimL family protein N-acetyltransferase
VRENEFGQPVGDDLDWTPPPPVGPVDLPGDHCRLVPLGEEHAEDLFQELCVDSPPETWTYLPMEPCSDVEEMVAHVRRLQGTAAMAPLAILTPGGRAVGIATYLRNEPVHGCVEVGFITMGSTLQRTTASTEALVLMARHVFALGYRRYEWKCDSLNEPSRRAAVRLGFTFEGVFRQAQVVKGRNRDTAWYALTDGDWPRVAAAYDAWLAPTNFDGRGGQLTPLAAALRDGR